MSVDTPDDLTLVRRAAAGDESALEKLYARSADPLFAFICHHLDGGSADAEDIWQDALMAGFRSLERYRGESRFSTWLCGIARRKIADHFRRHGGGGAVTFSEAPAEQLACLMDSQPLPEETLARRDTRIRVVEALAELPEDYRTALVSRYADRQSVDQVARALGRTYKATESLLSRARVAFRETLSAAEQEQHDER